MTSGTHLRSVSDLLRAIGSSTAELVSGSGAAVVDDITHDSRKVEPGTIFCCVRGVQRDGHDFASVAIERGATALLVDHHLDGVGEVAQIVVCLLYTSPSPRDGLLSRMPSSA